MLPLINVFSMEGVIIITDIPGQNVIHIPLEAWNEAHYANQVVKDIKALL